MLILSLERKDSVLKKDREKEMGNVVESNKKSYFLMSQFYVLRTNAFTFCTYFVISKGK